MTQRKRLGPGALVWAGFDGPQVPGVLLDAIRDGRIGGLVLFAFRGNIRSKEQVRAMLAEAQQAAARGGHEPIPVGVDQEGGAVVRIAYRAAMPSAMAIGATADTQLCERAARAVAEGLRADGIALNHAPVCDVNVEPRNPVIGTRAFGDDPRRVAAFAAAWVRGSEGAGVATSPKHFPGHGAAAIDSHHHSVAIGADRGLLERRELVPFRAAFAAGASAAMTGHIRFPALDAHNVATLSRAILIDLLRNDLGFTGLLFTDSLDMSAIADIPGSSPVVTRALNAGIDAVMVTSGIERQLAATDEILEGVRPRRVAEALRRATRFRERFGICVPDGDIDDAGARTAAREIGERSITHIGPPLPHLGGALRVTAVAPERGSPVEELADPLGTLESALRARLGERVRFARDASVPDGDGILVVCSSGAYIDDAQARRVRALLADGGILCALRSPYDAAIVPERPALLTFGDVPASLEALAAVLSGEQPARGTLPVRLG
ncbi:MAG: hypothetical protein M3O91_05060 [Chloroflexota bacterium]|nr:hypothetical protein [Chloroflexota bacterium]